jgi:uncharacterized protein YbjT (DUF2867 family)
MTGAMRITVAGAAGNLGTELVARLLQDGHAVTALDAAPKRLEALRPRLAGLHAVDLRQAASFQHLLAGAELVITTVGIGRPRKLSDYHAVDFQANLNLLRAAQAAGVRRFIYTSVARVDSDLSVPLLKAKYAFEQELKSSGLSWLVIRPSGYFTDIQRTFMTQARQGRITLVGTREAYRFSPIHPADVADFVARNLELAGQSVLLGGPEQFTYAEISQMCFDVLGKPANIQAIPLPIFNILLALLRLLNPPLYGVMSFLRWASTTDLTAPPVGKRAIRDYLRENLTQG